MIVKKEWIAMLLAGGQGSRLYALTRDIAKPAVPFGGKYRIIDFPLSNCVNSGIDTVGVLTQYQPLQLNEYLGNGQPWDLDRIHGGVYVLPPYQKIANSDWYTGTANAIYQNINFINRYAPEYVVILSGDHIYKMDYSKMLEFHKEKQADCTIAVMEVPWEEASRFGIMACDEDKKIYEFAEKPKEPPGFHGHLHLHLEQVEEISGGGRSKPGIGKRFWQERHSGYAPKRRADVCLCLPGLLEGRWYHRFVMGSQYGPTRPECAAGFV